MRERERERERERVRERERERERESFEVRNILRNRGSDICVITLSRKIKQLNSFIFKTYFPNIARLLTSRYLWRLLG